MKHSKKVLVSMLISTSLCSSNAGAISTAGWAGIGAAGFLAIVGIPTVIGCACSGKSNEKLLYAADPDQPTVTDEQKRKILFDFFDKYAKCDKNTHKVEFVDEKVKDKVVQTTVDGKPGDVNVLGILKCVSYFLSFDPKNMVAMDCFSYGLGFGCPLEGSYRVFVSDNCKFIRAIQYHDGSQDITVYCITFKID